MIIVTRGLVWRIVSLFVACIFALCSGTNYMFSSISVDLANLLGVPNADIIGSIADLGNFLGIIGGLICDKAGPKYSAIYCTVLVWTGYLLCWLSFIDILPKETWMIALYFFFIGQGQSAGFITVLTVNIRNWSAQHRSKIAGVHIGLLSLSPLLTTPIYTSLFNSNLPNFFLFFMILMGSVSFCAIFLVRDMSQEQKIERMGVADDDDDDVEVVLDSDVSKNSATPLMDKKPVLSKSITFPTVLMRIEFYMVWFGMLFGLGAALMWKNVFGTVNEALGLGLKDTMVIAWSLTDGPGRILHGFLSDSFAHVLPRPFWTVFPVFLMFIGNITFLVAGEASLWFTHISYAFGASAIFGTLTTIHSIYWGTRYSGLNLGVLLIAPGAGGTVVTSLVTLILDNAGDSFKDGICMGIKCFQLPIAMSSIIVGCSFLLFCCLTLWHHRYFKGQ